MVNRTCAKCYIEKPATAEFFDRYARNNIGLRTVCKACMQIYYRTNKIRLNARSKKYYEANKSWILIWQKKYAQEHVAQTRETHRRWATRNPEQYAAAIRDWRLRHPERVREYALYHDNRRRALKAGAAGNWTTKDVQEKFLLQRGKCAACKSSLTKSFHRDHIIALAAGGSNDKQNLQLLCKSCNSRKHKKDPIRFMQENGYLL